MHLYRLSDGAVGDRKIIFTVALRFCHFYLETFLWWKKIIRKNAKFCGQNENANYESIVPLNRAYLNILYSVPKWLNFNNFSCKCGFEFSVPYYPPTHI